MNLLLALIESRLFYISRKGVTNNKSDTEQALNVFY